MLRDPAFFHVELYAGFRAYGFIEVVENALRSILKHNNKSGQFSLLHHLSALSVFFVQQGPRSSRELGSEFENVDKLLDVLAALWRAALAPSTPMDPQLRERVTASVRDFRDMMQEAEIFAHFEWLDLPQDDADPDWILQETITNYLSARYAWQSLKELTATQTEQVITEAMLQALRSPPPVAANFNAPTPPRVRGLLKTLR